MLIRKCLWGPAWKLIGTLGPPIGSCWYEWSKRTHHQGLWFAKAGGIACRMSPVLYMPVCTEMSRVLILHASVFDVTGFVEEGSFIGKGIMRWIFSESAWRESLLKYILSHDLFGRLYLSFGLYVCAALWKNSYPLFKMILRGRSRWVRGDWQIFLWFFYR